MKKLALVAALFSVLGTAQAAGLSISDRYDTNPFANYDGQPATITGAETAGKGGNLVADVAGTISFTYLGQESIDKNRFTLDLGLINLSFYDNNGGLFSTPVGTTIFDFVNPGVIDFKFTDTNPNGASVSVKNGQNPSNGMSFAFLGNFVNGEFVYDTVTTKGTFDYIIGLNDLAGDSDYDDLVVGVKFTPKNPSAVPVPAALPLMATALGLFGFGASRRRL